MKKPILHKKLTKLTQQNIQKTQQQTKNKKIKK